MTGEGCRGAGGGLSSQTGAADGGREGVSGEAETGESLSQVGLPKHDGLFTCQVVAFVGASHGRQKGESFSFFPEQDHQCSAASARARARVCLLGGACSCCRVYDSHACAFKQSPHVCV